MSYANNTDQPLHHPLFRQFNLSNTTITQISKLLPSRPVYVFTWSNTDSQWRF